VIDANFEIGGCTSGKSAGLASGQVNVADLRKLIDDRQEIVILDVRPKEIRAQEDTIPGALSAHPANIDPALKTYPRGIEIVVYCACPNEKSAATAAKRRQAGFKTTTASRGDRCMRPSWTSHRTPQLRFPFHNHSLGESRPSSALNRSTWCPTACMAGMPNTKPAPLDESRCNCEQTSMGVTCWSDLGVACVLANEP
jgi:rhodanese-related sulfurtransferase